MLIHLHSNQGGGRPVKWCSIWAISDSYREEANLFEYRTWSYGLMKLKEP